mmetsp:Transcript_51916/g.103325  ORF Transcript_51916/g.103325 Transcript_51916/m.103325 type:complete len:215 (+) Transcript_51916:57-701(+)
MSYVHHLTRTGGFTPQCCDNSTPRFAPRTPTLNTAVRTSHLHTQRCGSHLAHTHSTPWFAPRTYTLNAAVRTSHIHTQCCGLHLAHTHPNPYIWTNRLCRPLPTHSQFPDRLYLVDLHDVLTHFAPLGRSLSCATRTCEPAAGVYLCDVLTHVASLGRFLSDALFIPAVGFASQALSRSPGLLPCLPCNFRVRRRCDWGGHDERYVGSPPGSAS